MKHKLLLNKRDIDFGYVTLGKQELLTYLVKSDLFDIGYHQETLKAGPWTERGAILYFDDKKICVDWWEYPNPTFCSATVNQRFDLIIKLQARKWGYPDFQRSCRKKKTLLNHSEEDLTYFFDRIVPWTFFSSKMFKAYVGREQEIPTAPITQFGFFCGKNWKCRKPMKAVLEKNDIAYYSTDQPELVKFTDDEVMQQMVCSKFGIVLRGRCSHFAEGKNRREIDYMMMRKPLLMNYHPNYYNPLVNGKHFIQIDVNTDFKNIENMYNIGEIAENAWQWYQDNATPSGAAKVFLQIMEERFRSKEIT